MKVPIKCDHIPLHTFLTVHTLNSKVNNLGTEIANIRHITFEDIKDKDNILVDSISSLRSTQIYEELPPIETKVNREINPPTQVEQNNITI